MGVGCKQSSRTDVYHGVWYVATTLYTILYTILYINVVQVIWFLINSMAVESQG